MKTAAYYAVGTTGTILWLLLVVPSCAFVQAAATPRKSATSNHLEAFSPIQSKQNPLLHGNLVRGGGSSEKEPNPLVLKATGADYTEAAKALFGNVISPAAMLTGGLVPLGFLADPLPDGDNNSWAKLAKRTYMILSVVSLANELLAIMYATVACNKLTEVAARPATSVFALIKRDYELPWIGTNLHFMLGLMGFVGMIMLRALCLYPKALNSATSGLAFSALIGMVSIVNMGISQGDGRGHKLGGNLATLAFRYVTLLVREIYAQKTVMGALSMVFFTIYTAKTVKYMLQAE